MQISSSASGIPDLHDLNQEAWEARFRDPAGIVRIADQMILLSSTGSLSRAWGYWHRAVSCRFKRDSAAMHAALASAEELFKSHDCRSGVAMCREQLARLKVNEGDETSARLLAAEAMAVPQTALSAWERFAICDLDVVIATRFSTPEATIRTLSRAMVAARETRDVAALAQTLSMLAGKHAELNNFETALTHGEEAYRIASDCKPGTAWYISALNLLLIHNGMGNSAEAMRLADELAPLDEQIFPPIREQSNLLYARTYLLTGKLQEAQVALDRSLALSPAQAPSYTWSSTHAALLHAQGEHQRARNLCDELIANTPREKMMLTPSVAVRIYRTAARSAESLGAFCDALAYERAAIGYVEIEFGRAALARRVALEVEIDFDRERAARDEADRKRVESEAESARLDELNRKLDAALQTRTRFLAAASHDLRQPAHALALYAQALEHETSRPALVDLSKRMRATVGSLSNMFDGLLELARLDAGVVKPQQEVFDLNELLARLCTEYADRLTHANALLRCRRTKHDCFVRNDAVLVERILRNLIGNAVKYAGEGNILVAARKRSGGIVVEVRDAGPGMSAQEQHHIFDEFYRASSANERRDGLGLGLSIVERFARLIDMHVSVRSALGRGTTFTLEIPASQLATRPTKSVEVEARAIASTSRRIAVIDDDPDARESMALVLTQWGHDCVAGESADNVIANVQTTQWKPDALICDFQLRGRNAIADIAALRETFGAGLPVLVVSGSHDAQATIAEQIPDAAYLPKPIRPLRLKSWLASIGRK